MQRDVNSFLSFFSSRAIQNKKDDLNEIRKIYTEFFNQSDSLVYQLKNPQIEISLVDARVKAFYEIRQVRKTGVIKLWRGKVEWALVREEGGLKILSLQYKHDRSP